MPRPAVRLLLALALLCGTELAAQKDKKGAGRRWVPSLFSDRALQRGKAPAPAEALAALSRLRAPAGKLAPAQRGRALRTVLRAYLAGAPLYAELRQQVDALRARFTPSFARSLRPERDPLSLLLVALDAHRARSLPAEKLRAHPAAAHFPGAVPDAAKRVTQRLRIDLRIPRWHSTGLYAPPGEALEVTVPEGVEPGALSVLIGCHTDSILRRSSWRRFPRIARRFPISGPGKYRVGNVFGGLVYLVVKTPRPARITVQIAGAVRAPYFVLGKTDPDAWRQTIRSDPAPFGELGSDQLILSLPAKLLRKLDDPAAVMRFWSRVVKAQDELASLQRSSPERFVFDIQISAGYMHSGYPLMGPVSAAAKALDLATLSEKGNWGMFHELGHNHQLAHFGAYANPWTFDGNVEVTCNIFASYVYEAVLHRPKKMAHQHWRHDLLPSSIEKYHTQKPYAKKSHRERCLFWVQLATEFGWQGIEKIFAAYARLPRAQWPKSDLQKRSLLLEVASHQTGVNLATLFTAWQLETTPAAKQAVSMLAAYTPKNPVR